MARQTGWQAREGTQDEVKASTSTTVDQLARRIRWLFPSAYNRERGKDAAA